MKKEITDGTGNMLSDARSDEVLRVILQTLVENPVRAFDGHFYDRKNIKRWFALADGRSTCSFTGKVLIEIAVTVDADLQKKVKS